MSKKCKNVMAALFFALAGASANNISYADDLMAEVNRISSVEISKVSNEGDEQQLVYFGKNLGGGLVQFNCSLGAEWFGVGKSLQYKVVKTDNYKVVIGKVVTDTDICDVAKGEDGSYPCNMAVQLSAEYVGVRQFTVLVFDQDGQDVDAIDVEIPALKVDLSDSKHDGIYDTVVLTNLYSEKIEILNEVGGKYMNALGDKEHREVVSKGAYIIKLTPNSCSQNRNVFKDSIQVNYKVGAAQPLTATIDISGSCEGHTATVLGAAKVASDKAKQDALDAAKVAADKEKQDALDAAKTASDKAKQDALDAAKVAADKEKQDALDAAKIASDKAKQDALDAAKVTADKEKQDALDAAKIASDKAKQDALDAAKVAADKEKQDALDAAKIASDKAKQDALDAAKVAADKEKQDALDAAKIASDKAKQDALDAAKVTADKEKQDALDAAKIASDKAKQDALDAAKVAADKEKQDALDAAKIASDKAKQDALDAAKVAADKEKQDALDAAKATADKEKQEALEEGKRQGRRNRNRAAEQAKRTSEARQNLEDGIRPEEPATTTSTPPSKN